MKDKEDIIKLDGKKYIKEKFLIEEVHPAVGRILIIDDIRFKILDKAELGERSGTFISKFTEEDEESIKEYDEELERLSSKLAERVDIKRLIKENIKEKSHQEIKTGLFILKAKEDGEVVEEEHSRGCYKYKIHYKNQTFDMMSGSDVLTGVTIV